MNETLESPSVSTASAGCFHGGAFFEAIGPDFRALHRRHAVINADVLDAWFPPAPLVLAALQEHLPWLLRTSPPIGAEGLVEAIAAARGVAASQVLAGPGSSALIYLALGHWLRPESRVLLLDPTYGEYAHVLERVIGCRIDRLKLERSAGYRLDLAAAAEVMRGRYDLIVLVNPNNPTGQLVPGSNLRALLTQVPEATRVWIDEAYIDYARPDESMEQFAVETPNVVVCKSLSKVLALSGARAAYLCGAEGLLAGLRRLAPPWWVSLTAQVAAVAALGSPHYYEVRYRKTHRLRQELARGLESWWETVPGSANFVLCHLPPNGPTAKEVIRRCRERDLFLRDVSTMGTGLGDRILRVAVKDSATNQRMLNLLAEIAD